MGLENSKEILKIIAHLGIFSSTIHCNKTTRFLSNLQDFQTLKPLITNTSLFLLCHRIAT
jgi:hypothetical protein